MAAVRANRKTAITSERENSRQANRHTLGLFLVGVKCTWQTIVRARRVFVQGREDYSMSVMAFHEKAGRSRVDSCLFGSSYVQSELALAIPTFQKPFLDNFRLATTPQ